MDYVKQNPSFFSFNNYQDIPLDDIKVYELFANKEANKTSIAVPEFGTNFVISMLKDIYDKEKKTFNFATLVKVSGLSHGTNVWTQNAKDILAGKGDFKDYIKEKISFDEVIACRDEIMNTLIEKGVDPLRSFEIMEFVRKGKLHTHPKEWDQLISPAEVKIPKWYLKSLTKIKYLFPKAHAVAYVLMAMRIAWFKVNQPLLFYSGYFTKRSDQFDYNLMLKSAAEIDTELQKHIKNQDNEKINSKTIVKKEMTAKEQSRINTLKSASEMLKLGYKFLPIDLNKSEANEFVIENNNALRMPFVAIDGLGQVAADNIVMNRKEKLFTQKDFVKRVKINKTILKKFKDEMIIEKLPEE
jgi:DNA polymerase-3 subunit alpha (Gram-positive type)